MKLRLFYLTLFFLMTFQGLSGQNIEDIQKGKANFSINSSISLTGGTYMHWGTSMGRNNPYIWNLNGTVSFSLFGIQFPFSFNLGPQQRGFTQPFNQYGVSPYWKWIKLHGGWRSMNFSPYVMQGMSFLGGGIELTPKNFRFGAFYGRINKATPNDTSRVYYPLSVFDRWAYGVKIGAGNSKNYFDVMVLKSRDDTTSKKTPGRPVLPGQDNLVAGIGAQVTFLKNVVFKLDVAASLLTNDVGSTLASPFSNSVNLGSFMKTNATTTLLFAGESSLGYQGRNFGLRFLYSRTDPNFTSHGIMYRQGDLESYTLEPRFSFWKGKIRFFGSIGAQHDNVNGNKAFTSWRTIGSANLSLNPVPQYGLDLNFSNYGLTQRAGTMALNDTFRIAQNNRTYGLTQRLSFNNKVRSINIMMNGTYQQLINLNRFFPANGSSDVIFGSVNFSYTHFKSNLSANVGASTTKTQFGTQQIFLIGPSLGFTVGFMKNKMNVNLGGSYNMSLTDGSITGNTTSANLGWNYRIDKTNTLMLMGYFLNNVLPGTLYDNITELRIMGGYMINLNFSPKSKKDKI